MTRLIVLTLALAGLLLGVVLIVRYARAKALPDTPDGPVVILDLGKGVTLELVRIEPGEYEMGSDESEVGHDPSESPRHTVKIAKAFYLGRYEVNQGQWEAVMNFNQAQKKGDAKQAVDSISWTDARKFCAYGGQKAGRTLRLPTEAEWEYACRAGTKTPWSSGQKLSADDAVFNWSKLEGGPAKPEHPAIVGSKKPNAWGLYDMHGNVWEWCEDAFTQDYAKHPGTQAAVTAEGEPSYVYRGGCWRSGPEECRSAVRFAGPGELRSDVMGFRVAVDAQAKTESRE